MNILFKEEPILETVRFSVQQDREVPIPGFFILSSMRNIRSIDELSRIRWVYKNSCKSS